MKRKILDHGYVEFIEAWGHGKSGLLADGGLDMECGLIEAARQSTQGSFRGWKEDSGLLGRLHKHRHATPFEFAGMVIEIQAPIFVFREWHRHRTQSYNEMSARYAPMPDVHFLPEVDTMFVVKGDTNRQAAFLIAPHSKPSRKDAWISEPRKTMTTGATAMPSPWPERAAW